MGKAITMRQVEGKPGNVYYPYAPHSHILTCLGNSFSLQIIDTPTPEPGPNELVVEMHAAGKFERTCKFGWRVAC